MGKRKRRTDNEMFLDKLREISNGETNPVGNTALRNALGWNVDRYEKSKSKLVGQSLITLGRGKGGSVMMSEPSPSEAPKVFISYSHSDADMMLVLCKHLEPLKRLNLIELWTDNELKAGVEWDKYISEELKQAEIILLLISIDFINSEYCYQKELEHAMNRHKEGSAKVVPIILRDCLWKHEVYSKIQALPKHAKPVTTWPDLDEVWTQVAGELMKTAKELRK